MELQILIILILFVLLGFILAIVLSLIPLCNQIKRTAQQFRIASSSIDDVLLKDAALLSNRGAKALREFEDIYPLVQAGLYYLLVQQKTRALHLKNKKKAKL